MKYCTNCGNKLSENSVVCAICAKLLDSWNNNINNNSNKKKNFLVNSFNCYFFYIVFVCSFGG